MQYYSEVPWIAFDRVDIFQGTFNTVHAHSNLCVIDVSLPVTNVYLRTGHIY